jgi:predicted  nucleic acid-binding Zn-ribbon protein
MPDLDITPLQNRVIALIAQVNILSQDVAMMRQRTEEISAAFELGFEQINRRLDEADLKHNLLRQEMDAGFQSVLEAIGKLHEARHD